MLENFHATGFSQWLMTKQIERQIRLAFREGEPPGEPNLFPCPVPPDPCPTHLARQEPRPPNSHVPLTTSLAKL